jgi:NADPH:quinone reductase-like Zn-dependent oxidoreductase
MIAVRFHETGAPDVLRMEEVDYPQPDEGEIVVGVRACGINRADLLARGNLLPWPVPLPHTLGADVAGVVERVGAGVVGLEPGQRVVVNPYLGCGRCRYCLAGRNNICRTSRVVGLQMPGGYADAVKVPASAALPLPDEVPFDAAASVVLVGLTAWHLLVTQAALRVGESVLIVGASSGVGTIGIQIAKAAGATVFAIVGSEEKRARALALGADVVFLDDEPDIAKAIKARTGGEGVDVVFEHVGRDTWATSLASMARGARLAVCGGHSGFDVGVHLAMMSAKEISLIGSYGGTARELIDLMEALRQGAIQPIIHRRYPLEQAGAAHAEMEQRRHFGKLVLIREG